MSGEGSREGAEMRSQDERRYEHEDTRGFDI